MLNESYILYVIGFCLFADATLTVDNVIKVLETVATDKTMKVLETCGISKSIMEAKGKCFLEDKKKIEVCVDLYLSCYQDEPTWESVTFALYECDEMAAAKEARNFQNNIGEYRVYCVKSQ